jgi:hypothetical protein
MSLKSGSCLVIQHEQFLVASSDHFAPERLLDAGSAVWAYGINGSRGRTECFLPQQQICRYYDLYETLHVSAMLA